MPRCTAANLLMNPKKRRAWAKPLVNLNKSGCHNRLRSALIGAIFAYIGKNRRGEWGNRSLLFVPPPFAELVQALRQDLIRILTL